MYCRRFGAVDGCGISQGALQESQIVRASWTSSLQKSIMGISFTQNDKLAASKIAVVQRQHDDLQTVPRAQGIKQKTGQA